MAIGNGKGPNKALQAVEQALHHPLLDTIPIESATGIIVNIRGGKYLTFMEVSDALNYLHEKTNNQAEIIPGIIQDDNMEDRTEIILIITGLGATAFDPMTRMRVPRAAEPARPSVTIADAITAHENSLNNESDAIMQENELVGAQSNLEIPAFMRRRLRQN